jgi:hypothetical protein
VFHVQLSPHTRKPLEPQLVVHVPLEPSTHSRPSSRRPSQSSSVALQRSAGGSHAPRRPPLQSALPVVPQLEAHGTRAPSMQAPAASGARASTGTTNASGGPGMKASGSSRNASGIGASVRGASRPGASRPSASGVSKNASGKSVVPASSSLASMSELRPVSRPSIIERPFAQPESASATPSVVAPNGGTRSRSARAIGAMVPDLSARRAGLPALTRGAALGMLRPP